MFLKKGSKYDDFPQEILHRGTINSYSMMSICKGEFYIKNVIFISFAVEKTFASFFGSVPHKSRTDNLHAGARINMGESLY